jgi:hypothetical protein
MPEDLIVAAEIFRQSMLSFLKYPCSTVKNSWYKIYSKK